MWTKNSKNLYQSFFPLYILLKISGMFLATFDSLYDLQIGFLNRIHFFIVISISPMMLFFHHYCNQQIILNESKIFENAIEVHTHVGGVFLVIELIYQYSRF